MLIRYHYPGAPQKERPPGTSGSAVGLLANGIELAGIGKIRRKTLPAGTGIITQWTNENQSRLLATTTWTTSMMVAVWPYFVSAWHRR